MDLYQAILANPEDRDARLRYAEWLESNGQAGRGELIRTQLRMAELEAVLDPDNPNDPQSLEWDRLSERVHELMSAHPQWRSELPALPGIKWGAGQFWGFSGGFVSSVIVQDGKTFVTQMGALFAAAPVTAVKIDYPDDATVQAIAASPHLARIRDLRLSSGACGDLGAAALANSPHAANLRFLSFFMCRVGASGAAALAGSPYLRKDLTLQLTGNPIGKDDTARLRQRFGDRVEV